MSSNQIMWIKLKITWMLFFCMTMICNEIFASSEHSSPSKAAIQAQVLDFPLSFENNQGQTDPKVKYLVRGQGYTMFFTPEDFVMTFNQGLSQTSSVLKMQFVGANPNPEIKGLEEQGHKTNYFIKNDPKKWRTNISNYKKIWYREVYPGIDIIFYGNGRQLEYDICVAPNSNPNQARFQIEGTEKLFIDENGNLNIVIADQNEIQMLMLKPFVYQVIEGKRVTIDSQFQLLASNEVGFKLGSYDPSQILVIDPVLGYSTYLGGTGEDFGLAIAIDSAGNAYVTGSTTSLDFPITPGAYQSAIAGGTDVFITKINPTGSALIYSTYLGGTVNDIGNSIAIDSLGNAYITGETLSSDFPTTPGVFQPTKIDSRTSFITKIDPLGQNLVYSTFLGGAGGGAQSIGKKIVIDSTGNAYVVGSTTSLSFPTTTGAFQTSRLGSQDCFVTKLNPTGTAVIYSTYLGGSIVESANSIAVDGTGNAYVTGNTSSLDFPTTLGSFQTSFQGGSFDGFITKLNPTGTALVYSTYLGGSGTDNSNDIVIDNAGNAYVTGNTNSLDFPTTLGSFQTSFQGGSFDSFITKLNPTGTAPVYSTYLGGSGSDTGFSIALDSSNNAYVSGTTTSNDFPLTSDAFQNVYGGVSDAFITQINTTGSTLIYSTYMGGDNADISNGIAVDSNQNIYVVGSTVSVNFPTTLGAFQGTNGGFRDAFIARFITSTTTTLNVSPNPADFGQMVTLTATVSPSVATGTVSFYDGVALLDTIPVVAGVAVYSTDMFTSGAHSLTAEYNGDVNFGGSISTPVNLVVNLAPTTITLNVSPNPADFGQMVSLTATISPSAATGTVSFYDGATLLDTVPVVAGVAVFSADTFTVGSHSLTAEYSGDASYDGSISSPVNLIVNLAATTTTLNVSPNPADFGQMVSLTATVSPSAATGTVSFFDGVTLLSTIPVVGGAAVFSTDTFTLGSHSLTAVYSGDAGYDGSTSDPVNLIVNLAATTTTLNVSPNPANFGQMVSLTATVSDSAATGTVSFYDGVTLISTVPVVGGVAVFSTDTFTLGSHGLTAVYSGDENYDGSTSDPVNLIVNSPGIATFTTLAAAPNPVIAGQPVVFTVTVSPPIVKGTVSLFSESNLLGTAVVVNGTATIDITAPSRAGIFPIIAIYSGDVNYSGSSSALVFLTVENPSVIVLQPRHLRGFQTDNGFATQSDIINVLKWKAPSSANHPVAYRIYRDSLDHLIAIVNANQSLEHKDHNRRKGKKYLYYVISVDEFGNFSEPKSIVIK